MSKIETIKSALKFLVQKQIKQGSHGFSDNNDNEVSWKEVLEWLEQQSSEDCISRRDAINELKLAYFNKDLQSAKDDPCIVDAMTDWAIRTIKNLPSVTPQPKRGKWEVIRKEYEFMGGIVNEPQGCKCSNCDGIVKFKSDFCPSCGADMREVQDGE